MICYFRRFGPCWSPILDRCHLIPKQRLKHHGLPHDDERTWVWGCRHHHHLFDSRFVRLKRSELPAEIEDYAREHGIEWSLDRDYGEREVAA